MRKNFHLIFASLTVISAQFLNFDEINPKKCNVKPELKNEIKKYSATVKKIIDSITKKKLRNQQNNRLDQFEKLVKTAKIFKMEKIRTEKFDTITWVFADAFAEMKKPIRQKIKVATIATHQKKYDIEKEVVIFDSLEEMQKNSKKIKGKIVVFNLNNKNPFEDIKTAGEEFFKVKDYQPAAVLSASLVPPSKIKIPDATMRLFQGKNSGEYKVTPSGYISVEDAIMLPKKGRAYFY